VVCTSAEVLLAVANAVGNDKGPVANNETAVAESVSVRVDGHHSPGHLRRAADAITGKGKLLRLEFGRADYLAPLLGFINKEFSEIRR
jgi:hypothetical protein